MAARQAEPDQAAAKRGDRTGRRIATDVGSFLLVAGILTVFLLLVRGTLVTGLANDQTWFGTDYLPQSRDPATTLTILHQRGFRIAPGNTALAARGTGGGGR